VTDSVTAAGGASKPPRLMRALGLWDLVLYGVIIVCPISPAPFYGVLILRGHGHAALTVLVALFAMLPTAISYGRMANAYPTAGSAFAYVGQEINPLLGYLAGWGMVMDYLLNPLCSVIWVSQQAHVYGPLIPYWVWVAVFAGLITALTIHGIKFSARVNVVMGATIGVVIVVFIIAATHYVLSHPHAEAGFFSRPFYDPSTWTLRAFLGGTSLAMLTYIGFDGISTLSEECKNPRRHILLATIMTCVIVGILSVVEVYAAQLVWPGVEHFPDQDTAFTFAAQRAWAPLFVIVGVTLMIALFAIAVAAQLAVARLLYGMGRSGALPGAFFSAVHPVSRIPRNNVMLVGGLLLAGGLVLPAVSGEATGYELAANLVNFGALVSFMGVNAAALIRYYVRAPKKKIINLLLPLAGFVICLVLWWNLSYRALLFGLGWMVIGITFAAWRTRGFSSSLAVFEISADHAD
jgi:putrescine importer